MLNHILQIKTTSILEEPLKEEDIKVAFFALITNKCPGYDKLQVNIIRELYYKFKK